MKRKQRFSWFFGELLLPKMVYGIRVVVTRIARGPIFVGLTESSTCLSTVIVTGKAETMIPRERRCFLIIIITNPVGFSQEPSIPCSCETTKFVLKKLFHVGGNCRSKPFFFFCFALNSIRFIIVSFPVCLGYREKLSKNPMET